MNEFELKENLSVIILTFNEELHIKRCIENVKSFVRDIYVVDSFSNDSTVQISESLGAKVFQNKWENNYAKQFNWALNNLPITSEWILRLDADEYLLPELIDEIRGNLCCMPEDVSGIIFKRRHIFLERWMKNGVYPVKLLRIFRYKKAVCEQRWMDEHIQLLNGLSVEFKYDFVDHNLNNISWFLQKHIGYSIREAVDLLDIELDLCNNYDNIGYLSDQAKVKRLKKYKYVRSPLFLRSFAYFIYRYILKCGFLDGKVGFLWHFFQGWWYRTLVDVKVWEIKKNCGNDKDLIKRYVLENYNIKI